MTTQVFVASTTYGLATLVAALDEGLFPFDRRTERDQLRQREGRRVLVVTNNAAWPEVTPDLTAAVGWDALRVRFDDVVDFTAAIAPLHPAGWLPRAAELPLWDRFLRQRWGLGDDDLHLVVESIQAAPAHTLTRIFADARIDVYADGLMSYGPTRSTLPDTVGWRIERLLHLDLVPGLTPLLLSEWQVPPVVVPLARFRTVVDTLAPGRPTPDEPYALVLGQYLAAADLLTAEEETALYVAMIVGAGHRRVVFKPHPSAPPTQHPALIGAAAAAGIELEISPDRELVESRFARGSVGLVVGCFSTALLTAATAYGIPVARHGTELLLDRLAPYQNSNRIPVTLVDALVPALVDRRRRSPVDLDALVIAVGYAMQPQKYADRRDAAVVFLAAHPEERVRYVKRKRLTRLGLPGGLPPQPSPWRKRLRRSVRRRPARVLRAAAAVLNLRRS